ncbi:MAG: SHOCT domain-containing protein [Clostridia bacterium]|nr:SHOCT domain-containing protein [Clostridia bacterium]MBR2874970.1 SHOCT domain-containing protein [Clostridia bacterium]
MNNEKNNNLTRFLLTFFLGWIGSIIINMTDLKPQGYKSRTLAYLFLGYVTLGIYSIVASISNLYFDPNKQNIGYVKEEDVVSSTTPHQNSIYQEEEIIKYKEMLDKGIISEEDFNAKRKQILGI